MKDTHAIGNATEAEVVAALLRTGRRVWLPFGDGNRCDLLFQWEGAFTRVQCKSGRRIGTSLEFEVTSSSKAGHKGYLGDVDAFATFDRTTGICYLVPVADCNKRKMRLAVQKNGRRNQFILPDAKDFEIK